MAEENEIDDVQNQNGQQQNDDQGGQQQQDSNVGQGRVPESLDNTLDDFIKAADGQPRTPASNQKQEGQVDPNKQKQGQPNQQPTQQNQNNGQQQQPANKQGSQQNQQTQQIPAPSRKFGDSFVSDQQGNIYNARGELIARPGAGHQLFRRLYPYIEKAELEATGLRAKVENYERATSAAKEAGLSLDEQSAALSLMVAYKKDPKAAINFLLQQASGRGIDTSDIVQGGGGVTESAIRNVLEEMLEKKLERFAPFIQQQQSQQEMQAAQQEALHQYHEFLEERPDAVMHQGAIASIMEAGAKAGKNFSMVEAYYELKTDALSRGLDWTKPLAPQYAALQNKGGNNRQPNGGGNQNQRQLPDFGGRTNAGVTTHTPAVADANDSWDSIIEGAVATIRNQQQVN